MLRIAGTILQQRSWDNLLRSESLTRDVYQDFQGTFSDDKKMLPDGILGVVQLAGGANSHTVGLLKNLSGDGVVGRDEQLGEEVDQELLEQEIFSNDVSQAVNTETYGIDAHDKSAYKILARVQPQLSLWHKEIKGKYIREALLEKYSSNLLAAPTSLVKGFNENILVKGVDLSAQPAYDSTPATYVSNISTALGLAGPTDQWDVHFLSVLNHWITAIKTLEPMDNGRYVVTVPSRQALVLRDVANSGSVANFFRDSHVAEAATNAYRWYLGSFGEMDLFEDPRAPVVGDDGGVLTAGYKGAGSDDSRAGLAGTLFDVGFVHGKTAAWVAMHEQMHFEEEIQNYRKVVGVGAFAGYGVNRNVYDDLVTPTDTSLINQNSAAIFARRATITA
jgi:hypothetical protein